jgi:pyruvate/2-oxoglutarate dehydrogenase complex dihydrolipoamide dehydrogenase (E3) component
MSVPAPVDVTEVDAVVLGLGPGGEDLAGKLADAGLQVVGVDAELVGGECPYWGCVPSKMMVRAADLLAEGRRIRGMAGASEVTPDWGPVARRLREEATDDWHDTIAVKNLERRGVTVVKGWGRLDGPHRVIVDDQVFSARRAVVLACGARSWAPPVEGLEGTGYWTNREAIEAPELPRSLAVLGGGAIGLELGQMFSRFGVPVTIVEAADRLMTFEEPEASEMITGVLRREGVAVITGSGVRRVSRDGKGFTLELEGRDPVCAERLLVAAGRRVDLAAIGAATVGVDESARGVPVDGRLRVVPGVWALGDITGIGAFTHVSMYQSAIVSRDILGQDGPEADYRALPRVTFTDPEIGSVGLSEAEARRRGLDVRTGSTSVASSTRGWIHKAGNDGFIKLVEDAATGTLVGATAAGPNGGEVLGLLALAVYAEVPTERMRHMIYAYPTFHRAIEAALADLAV